jgi:hypothetical protein
MSENAKADLANQLLEHNYTLERVGGMDCGPAVVGVLRLNAAGRSYVCEDAACKEKCIQVLDKVKDDLHALYFHLKENPILFLG